jgi:SAM-dependent methyltransferase
MPVAPEATSTAIRFTCTICGCACETFQRGRDVPNCPTCNSTARIRAVVRVLSEALFGNAIALPDFPERPDLRGVGLNDWGYTPLLAERFDYLNTYYDIEPRLDITEPPEDLCGKCDFLVASDVFEHVVPPIERAFEGAYKLLKPGGVLILTVPYVPGDRTVEHFPSLHDWRVEERDGSVTLFNTTTDGRREVFENVHCHGGRGLTVEMRRFGQADVRKHLRAAGFREIVDWRKRRSAFDPGWTEPHSFPFTAIRRY